MEIRTIQPFLQYFGNVRERTMRVARCIRSRQTGLDVFAGKIRADLVTSARAKQCRVTVRCPWVWPSWKKAQMLGSLVEPSVRADPRPLD